MAGSAHCGDDSTLGAYVSLLHLGWHLASLGVAEAVDRVRGVGLESVERVELAAATIDQDVRVVGGEVVDAMPDLSALPGWRSEWALPVGVTATVVVTTYEAPEALGDGTMQRATGNSAVITP